MKQKLLIGAGCIAISAMMSSCSLVYVSVTDNPVGGKIGKSSRTPTSGATIKEAVAKGKIEKIGTIKFKQRILKQTITVTGT